MSDCADCLQMSVSQICIETADLLRRTKTFRTKNCIRVHQLPRTEQLPRQELLPHAEPRIPRNKTQ